MSHDPSPPEESTGFEDWLRESLPALLRYARVLCGTDRADSIVRDVAIKMHTDWPGIEHLDLYESHARNLITKEYLSRRKGPRTGPHLPGDAVDRFGSGFWFTSGDDAFVSMSLDKEEPEQGPPAKQPEPESVNGLPAVLSAEQDSLVLDVHGESVRVQAFSSADYTVDDQSQWPAGKRDLLIRIAESLIIAEDLSDQSTWFEVEEALPK